MIWPLKPYISAIRRKLGIRDDIGDLCTYFGGDKHALMRWMEDAPDLPLSKDTMAYVVLRAFHIEPREFIRETLPTLLV